MSLQLAKRRRRWLHVLVWGGCALTALAMFVGLVVGAADVDGETVLRVLGVELLPAGWVEGGGIDRVDRAIVWSMRAPRVVLGALVGGSLALAGALMQGLFRNPLAAPGIIGTSSGASLGALIALSFGLSLRSMFYVPLLSVLGALLSLVVVVRIATRNGVTPVATLLLAGVAMTAFIGAINGWIIANSWAEWEVARRIAFWLMGGIVDRTWIHVALLLPCFVAGLGLALWFARDLDLMLDGVDSARALGVDTVQTQRVVLITAALLTGGAVAVSGIVGFVGLVIPHLVRLGTGPGHRALLPACVVSGAWFLVLADLVARTATAPVELHLGVVTASIGAPFFMLLLMRHRREASLL